MVSSGVVFATSACCLALFALIGVFDGLYFHLWKFRLHEHPESRTEHRLHTARAFCFSAMGLLFYVVNAGGWLLWFAVTLLAADLALEVWDVLVEKEARAKLGGISSAEQVVHILATGFKTVSVALVLIAKPGTLWSLGSPAFSPDPHPRYLVVAGVAFAVSTFLGGVMQWRATARVPRHLDRCRRPFILRAIDWLALIPLSADTMCKPESSSPVRQIPSR